MQIGFVHIEAQCLSRWVFFYLHYLCKEARLVPTEKDIQSGTRKTEVDEMQKYDVEEKGDTVFEKWECEYWKLHQTDVSVNEHLSEFFLYKRPMRQDQLLDEKVQALYLFTYRVVLRFWNIHEYNLQTTFHFSKVPTCVDKILDHYCRSMLRGK